MAWTLPATTGWRSGPDRQRRRRRVAARRLRHLPRPRLPVGLLAERRQPADQSAERARARRSPRLPGILNVSDPTLGFVFVPGPQTIRHSITIAADDLGMPYTHQWSATYERKLPWSSSLRVTYNGNHGVGTLKYSLANLPLSPLDGPVTLIGLTRRVARSASLIASSCPQVPM